MPVGVLKTFIVVISQNMINGLGAKTTYDVTFQPSDKVSIIIVIVNYSSHQA